LFNNKIKTINIYLSFLYVKKIVGESLILEFWLKINSNIYNMKTKFNGILTLFFALVVHLSFAQEKTITGTVSDQTGPLPGVSILIKGTLKGIETDFNGKYTLKVEKGNALIFRYLGYKTVERSVGNSNIITVTLEKGGEVLDEIIVTALGVKRQAKSLGYGVTTLKASEINEVRATSTLGALAGKSSGVVIQNQSGNIGGSQRILIRGISTLGGNQQPLFVIDGVPISNSQTATGSRISGGFDFGNRAQDINPDDIETISILKGASAAALYGSRAANGVVIITSKKGKKGSKTSVVVNSTLRFDTPLQLPNFQNEYAFGTQDADGNPVTNGDIQINGDPVTGDGNPGAAGWGERISDLASAGRTFINYDGTTTPFKAFENNIKDFYGTGTTAVNSIAVSGATDIADYRLSLSHNDQKGIIPGSGLNRTNLGLNSGFTISDKLKARTNFNYVRTNITGTAAAGANDPNVLTNIINGLPRTADINIFRDFIDNVGNQLNTVGLQTNNPFFVSIQNAPSVTVQRFYGNSQLEYEPIENLNFLGRVGYDTFTDTRLLVNRIGTLGRERGRYTDDIINQRELTLDFIASYQFDINKDFTFSVRSGVQWNERVFERFGNTGTNLTVPGLFAPGNAENNVPSKAFAARRIFGVFGDISLDYKDWAFINFTGRRDSSSTLPIQNRDFFYPSISASLVLSDALDIKSETLSYLKLRGNWANVGNDTSAYLSSFNYSPDTGFFGQFGTGGNFPFDGQVTFNSGGVLPDPNLVSENQTNFEFGVEFGLFDNRITVDATYYKNTTKDQIVNLPTPETTGFGFFLTNIGEIENEGIEIELGAKIIRTNDFSWNVNANFTTNQFTAVDLGGRESFQLASGFSSLTVRAVEGGELELFGTGFERVQDAEGNDIDNQILVNSDGVRTSGNERSFGSIFPDFTTGLSSVIKYKGFSLSTTFDYRQGGKLFSNTVGQLRRSGVAAETAANNRAPIIDAQAFMLDAEGNAVPNTIEASPESYWNGFSSASVPEGNIFDATFIKWRELSLTYSFPSKNLKNTFLQGASLGVQGRNLAIFNSKVPHIDPEASLGGAASSLQGVERGAVPGSSSVGFNLNLKF
jgi:TonB-linked SusC/RagA family outer membrane protein